jgi:phosphoglucosamine mutase
VERYPQLLINVPVRDRDALSDAKAVWETVEEVRQELGELGRVLVRPSGTEAVVRVMVEAADAKTADDAATAIVNAVQRELGPPA